MSHLPVAHEIESDFAFFDHPFGHVKLEQVGAGVVVTVAAGVVVTVVTMLQHTSRPHAGPCAFPHKMAPTFGL